MDYSGMKKEDLIKLLLDQEHLAAAVEAKDAEINGLRKNKDVRVTALEVEKDRIRTAYEEQIVALKNEIRSLQEHSNKLQEQANASKLTKEVQETLVKKNEALTEFGNKYIKMHTNMIQSIQGTLELASDLEKVLIEKVQKSQEK